MFYDVTVVASTEGTTHTYLVSYNIANILSNTFTPTHSQKLATKIIVPPWAIIYLTFAENV